MGKIFRLHSTGKNTVSDWGISEVIGNTQIGEILDPNGASPEKEITSIPSPFARVDLVKNAFREVNRLGLDGDTIFHKIVSEAFDIGEIFFNFHKYRNLFQIIIWDPKDDLEQLLQSSTKGHQILGQSIKMYMEQDAAAYNFKDLKRIYLLNYIGEGKPSVMNIAGGTSPSTLFFSSANDLSYISKHVAFGQNRPFDVEFTPLSKRDFYFIQYLWAFKHSCLNFAALFPEVDEYLQLTYGRLLNDQQNALMQITQQSIDSYSELTVSTATNHVEILGHKLHHKPEDVTIESDFEIESDLYKGTQPLVLPIDNGNTYCSLRYTQDVWSKNNKAPIYDSDSWKKRILPFDNGQYPYLTISDFLEDSIIQMPYNINSQNYFDGNVSILSKTPSSYLLPLKGLFFDFFTADQLIKGVNGKKMIEMAENAGGITVTLRIPIKGNSSVKYVEYQRIYFENNAPDLNKNRGAIIKERFGLGMLPAIKFQPTDAPHYRVAFFDKSGGISLQFQNGGDIVEAKAHIIRKEKEETCSVESYIVEKQINRITVNHPKCKAIIIPILKLASGSSQFIFAVDFGTTNTHIEYAIDGAPSKPFDITSQDRQIERLHIDYNVDKDITSAFDHNFIPNEIGPKQIYKFPTRTVYSVYNKINYTNPIYTLASGNISFKYGKEKAPLYNKFELGLKWSAEKKGLVHLFIENIFILLRNKVLLNGGSLSKTKIVWFYPASMTEAQCNKLKDIWQGLFEKYFGDNLTNLVAMSESVAPYNYYIKTQGGKSNLITIDIGGETTDVYVVEDHQPQILSSFRFASNAVFGDGYNWDANNNGFVKLFFSEIHNALNNNNLVDFQAVCESIENKKSSTELVSFFFTLSQDQEIKDKNIHSLDFLSKISDNDQLKYVFVVFYTAIIYYIAHLMKTKGLAMPSTIAFSGNGSKTLGILSSDNHVLNRFAKMIFEEVYGKKYDKHNDLELIYNSQNPKEATCKGGISDPKYQQFEEIDKLKTALLGRDMTTLTNKESISDIDDSLREDIVAGTKRFIDFVFDIHSNNDSFFTKKFNADASIAEKVKAICLNNLMDYTKAGLNARKVELEQWGADGKIDETLFFLPLIGVLNNLAREIANMKQEQV